VNSVPAKMAVLKNSSRSPSWVTDLSLLVVPTSTEYCWHFRKTSEQGITTHIPGFLHSFSVFDLAVDDRTAQATRILVSFLWLGMLYIRTPFQVRCISSNLPSGWRWKDACWHNYLYGTSGDSTFFWIHFYSATSNLVLRRGGLNRAQCPGHVCRRKG